MSTMEPIQSGLRLRVLEGGSHEEVLVLERSVISLGRSTPDTVSSPAYLAFPEPTVSRLHAVLTWEAGVKTFLLHHRSQTNLTIVNNVPIEGPQLLKVGDQIILGRLIMVVEADQAGAVSVREPAKPELALNAQIEGSDRTFSAPVRGQVVVLSFVNDRSTAQVSEPVEWQEVRLPGKSPSSFRFHLDSTSSGSTVEPVKAEQPLALRSSSGKAGAVLWVPMRFGHPLGFTETDVVLHQGYRIWLGDPEACPESGNTLGHETQGADGERRPTPKVTLKFLTGPWQEGVIRMPAVGVATLALGPGELGFRHPFPWASTPRCEIVLQDGKARLRAVEVADDQFLEVDGDLVFVGESVPLFGGSRISLGEAEFLWQDGSEQLFENFVLRQDSQTYPIRKAIVRIGTAAHCEVMLSGPGLPPFVGAIDFTGGKPVYRHHDISAPIRVDGEEASTGLSVPLSEGSVLELKPGVLLYLETHQS